MCLATFVDGLLGLGDAQFVLPMHAYSGHIEPSLPGSGQGLIMMKAKSVRGILCASVFAVWLLGAAWPLLLDQPRPQPAAAVTKSGQAGQRQAPREQERKRPLANWLSLSSGDRPLRSEEARTQSSTFAWSVHRPHCAGDTFVIAAVQDMDASGAIPVPGPAVRFPEQ